MSKKGTAVNQIKEMAADWKSGVQEMVDGSKDIAKALEQIKESLEEVTKSYKEMGQAGEEANKAAKQDADQDAKKKADIEAITNAYTLMFGVLEKLVQKGMEFEDQMANLKAGSGASVAVLEESAHAAETYGPQYGISDSKTVEAMNQFQGAGYSLSKLAKGDIKDALSLITAGELNTADAAKFATNAIKTYASEQLSLKQVANMAVSSANAGTVSVKEMADANAALGNTAATLGSKFEDVNNVFALFGKNSLSGTDAGKSLSAGLNAIIKPSDEAKRVMKDLGLQFVDSQGKLKSYGDMADMMHEKLAKFNDASKQKILTTLFTQDSAKGMGILADKGSAGLEAVSSDTGGSAAEDQAKTKLQSLSGQLKVLSAEANSAASQLGQTLTPALKPLVDLVTHLVQDFNQTSTGMKSFIGSLAMSGTAGLATIGVLKKVSVALEDTKLAALALGRTPIMLIITALVSLGTYFWSTYNQQKEAAEKAKQAQDELNSSILKAKTTKSGDELQQYKDQAKQIQDLGDQYKELQKQRQGIVNQMNDIRKSGKGDFDTWNSLQQKLQEIKKASTPLEEQLTNLGVSTDNYSQKVKEMNEAIASNAKGVLQMTDAKVQELATNQDHINSMQSLQQEYQKLSASESLSADQKARLKEVTGQLRDLVPNLQVAEDAHGRSIITNTGLINAKILAIQTEEQADKEATESMLRNSLAKVQAQHTELDARKHSLEAYAKAQEALAGQEGDNVLMRNMRSAANMIDEVSSDDAIAQSDEAALQQQINFIEHGHPASQQGNQNYDIPEDSNKDKGMSSGGGGGAPASSAPKEPVKSQDQILQEAFQKELQDAQHAYERGTIDRGQYIQRLQGLDQKYSQWLAQHENDRYSLESEIAKQSFQASSDWIAKKKQEMQDAGKTDKEIAQMEMDAWQRVADRDIYLADDRKQAQENLRQAKHDLAAASFKESQDWIAKEQQKMQDAGASEAEINKMRLEGWQRVNDRIKDGVYNIEDQKTATEELANAQREVEKTISDDLKAAREQDRDFAIQAAEQEGQAEEKKIQDKIDALDKEAEAEKYITDLKKEQQALDDLVSQRNQVAADKRFEVITRDKDGKLQKTMTADLPKLKELDKQIGDQKTKIGDMQKDHETELKRKQYAEDLQKQQDANKKKLDALHAYWDSMLSEEQISQDTRNMIVANGLEASLSLVEDYKNRVVQQYKDIQATIMSDGGQKPPDGYASSVWESQHTGAAVANSNSLLPTGTTPSTTTAPAQQKVAGQSVKTQDKNVAQEQKFVTDQAGKVRKDLQHVQAEELTDLMRANARTMEEMKSYWNALVQGQAETEDQRNTAVASGMETTLGQVRAYLASMIDSYQEAYSEIQQITQAMKNGQDVSGLTGANFAAKMASAAQSYLPSHQMALAAAMTKSMAADNRLSGLVNQQSLFGNSASSQRQLVVNGPFIDKIMSNASDSEQVARQVMTEIKREFFRMGSSS